MPDNSTNQDSRHRLVDVFVASVALVAVALDGRRLRARRKDGIVPPSKGIYVAIFCGLLFIGETRTRVVPLRRRRPSHARLGIRLQHRAARLAARCDCGDGRMHALRRCSRPQVGDQDRLQRRADHGIARRGRDRSAALGLGSPITDAGQAVVPVGIRDRRCRRARLHRQRSADLHRAGAALQDQRALDDGPQLLPQHLGRRRTAGAFADLRRRDPLQPDDAAAARSDRVC